MQLVKRKDEKGIAYENFVEEVYKAILEVENVMKNRGRGVVFPYSIK
jgi:hypothetical protein